MSNPKKKGILSFQNFTDKQSQNYLADHYPKGRLTVQRFTEGTVIYRLILSISTFVKIFVGDLFSLARNRDISKADVLLEEWETSVHIPSKIPRRNTIEGRREAVECLISKIPVYNIDDGIVEEKTTYEHYIKCLTGLDVEIRTARIEGQPDPLPQAQNTFPLEFAFTFGIDPADGNLISFPYKFGVTATSGSFLFIIGVPVSGNFTNNKFPLPFAVNFFDPIIPQATIDLLNLVLDRVIPSFCRWEFEPIIS